MSDKRLSLKEAEFELDQQARRLVRRICRLEADGEIADEGVLDALGVYKAEVARIKGSAPPKKYGIWTEAEDRLLKVLFINAETHGQSLLALDKAETFVGRTRSAIRARAVKLGIGVWSIGWGLD